MVGKHCVQTWSSTQGAIALSGAEAEFYAMIEAVIEAKGDGNTMIELEFEVQHELQLHTDSSAARSFVSRKGLGKMKYIEIRDFWLQREVALGKVTVNKVDRLKNPADFMTKYLRKEEVEVRLQLMGIGIQWDEFSRH